MLGVDIMYLAEFNFIGLFDNLGWCWGFACVKFIKVKPPQKIICNDATGVRNQIYTYVPDK